MVVILQNIY